MRSVALVGTDRVPGKRALGQRGLLLVVDHGGLVERLLPAEHALGLVPVELADPLPISTVATALPEKFVSARASDMKRSMLTISPTPSTRSGR
jgi:hypothetical protein